MKKKFKPPPKIGILTVDLSHGQNPDVASGYWAKPVDRSIMTRTCITDLNEAVKRCRRYIERNALGGGNWTGGLLCVDGVPIGRISYNGRVWDLEEKELTEVPRP